MPHDDFLKTEVHEEFAKRMEIENARLKDENNRQNERLESIEDKGEQIQSLALSVQELAASVKAIAKETERLGHNIEENIKMLDVRLKKIENRDGEKWRTAATYVMTAVIGIIVGFIFKQIGM